jgi:hypothetical protein
MTDPWNQPYPPRSRPARPGYGQPAAQQPYPQGEAYWPPALRPEARGGAVPPGRQQPPPGSHQYPPAQYPPPRPAAPRRKRRVFLWVFLAIQALFILWLAVGLATTHTGPAAAQLAQGCYHHAWYPLFKSQADCVQHYGAALQDAGNAGKAIGAGLIVVAWAVVDFFLAVGYGVWRLASR